MAAGVPEATAGRAVDGCICQMRTGRNEERITVAKCFNDITNICQSYAPAPAARYLDKLLKNRTWTRSRSSVIIADIDRIGEQHDDYQHRVPVVTLLRTADNSNSN